MVAIVCKMTNEYISYVRTVYCNLFTTLEMTGNKRYIINVCANEVSCKHDSFIRINHPDYYQIYNIRHYKILSKRLIQLASMEWV